MIGIVQKIKYIIISIGIFFVVIGTQGLSAQNIKFHDVASTVLMNSLAPLDSKHFLKKFYRQLFFVPVWVKEEGVSEYTKDLFTHIQNDKTLTQNSKLKRDVISLEYDIKDVYTQNDTLVDKVKLEFKIAQLYKGYADYKLYGSINWGAFQGRLFNLRATAITAGWITYKPPYSPISLMENVVMGSTISKMFAKAIPKEYHYQALHASLLKYLEIEKRGGWENIALHGTLALGKKYTAVPSLRERLRSSGDYKGCKTPESKIYDKCLQKAVIRFQKRHGLVAKGVMGKKTVTALNVPIATRITQMRLNLDRIKWLYPRKSARHIVINIPAFTLFFEEDNTLRQQMKVIVGKRKNPTPVFSNMVKTIVLNPQWNVPKSIIQKEMIPALLKNKNAMKKRGIEIFTGWDKDAKKISGRSVNWAKYRYSKTVPYRFAQVSGYRNALGKIKFLFPNEFSVYMHDTPNKKLFNRNVRAFSHGCIRLHKPRELLQTFSTFNTNINFKKSKKILKGKKKVYFGLKNKVPVDVIYLTAYVDNAGILQFRNDIYGYDKMQLQSYRKW
jgi:murein L,D-transpeptidase YcbB/YkuD